MSRILPAIKLNTTAPDSFLEEIHHIAQSTACVTDVTMTDNDLFGLRTLTIRPTMQNKHRRLFVQIIRDNCERLTVSVEVKADEWHPESPPDRDTYVSEAKRILTPLLLLYNRHFGTKKRLIVSSVAPKLPVKVDHAFRVFVNNANRSLLHSNDWEKFYKFVIQCFMARRFRPPDPESGMQLRNVGLNIDEDVVAVLLEREGFQPDKAHHLASIWSHCYDMLQLVRSP